jgi:chromosome segregation ATPase
VRPLTELSNSDQKHSAAGRFKRLGTRVDAPHALRAPERDASSTRSQGDGRAAPNVATEPSPPADAPINSAAAFVEHVQTQAAQLAEHLQRQRDNLDRREAELNAREAAVENQVRGARLWLEQREIELETRSAEIREQQQAIQEHLAQLGLNCEDTTIADIRGALTRQTDLIEARASELDDAERALAQREAKLEQLATQFEVRETYYDKTDKLLSEERDGLAAVRKQLELERAELDESRHQQQQQLRAAQSRADEHLAKQLREFERRSVAVEKREAALETLHDELMQSQREVLEVRLATEEIWSELSGMVSPAALTRSIAQVRARLAEQFSLAKADLAKREERLRDLAVELAAEHERLQLQTTELNEWVARRTEELERQAARLVASERQRDRQRTQDHEESLQWHAERLEYQREIRRLLTTLQETRSAAA